MHSGGDLSSVSLISIVASSHRVDCHIRALWLGQHISGLRVLTVVALSSLPYPAVLFAAES